MPYTFTTAQIILACTLMVATVVMAFRSPGYVLPYVFIAIQTTTEEDWFVITSLMVLWLTFSTFVDAVADWAD